MSVLKSGGLVISVQFAIAIVFCESVGVLGSLFSGPGSWYQSLRKPFFTPPGWLFGPAWVGLYAMMGVSVALVFRQRRANSLARGALAAFIVQLVLNAAWSPVFFGLHWLAGSMVIIVLLCGAILWTILAFWRVSRFAAVLLIPYFLWVCFASVLNISVYAMNR